MTNHTSRIDQLVLDELEVGERRVLSLVVATGKVLSREGSFKGDLTGMVKSALRALVESGAIVDVDGLYSIAPAQ